MRALVETLGQGGMRCGVSIMYERFKYRVISIVLAFFYVYLLYSCMYSYISTIIYVYNYVFLFFFLIIAYIYYL